MAAWLCRVALTSAVVLGSGCGSHHDAQAVRLGGASDAEVWASPRTRWEAGLRPLLMATRTRTSGSPAPAGS